MQLKEAEALILEKINNNFPKNCYYLYVTNENENMREYHVDTYNKLLSFVSDDTEEFGGNLSVRLNGRRPVLLVGQDESTFHQYTFSKNVGEYRMVQVF